MSLPNTLRWFLLAGLLCTCVCCQPAACPDSRRLVKDGLNREMQDTPLIAPGRDTFLHDLIELTGGVSITADVTGSPHTLVVRGFIKCYA